jgi:copper homeostasis protein (lipoprotein)
MNKWLGPVFILVLIFFLGAGAVFISQASSSQTYAGVLPGADCAGLKTELTLHGNKTYFLRETYLATRDGDIAYTSSGRWQKIKSGKYEIIQLNYEQTDEAYNFLITDADHLLVVGRELRPIETPMNLTLTRKK